MRISIVGGRPHFYQWDKDQLVRLEGVTLNHYVHFGRPDGGAYEVRIFRDGSEFYANVPNIWLQLSGIQKLYIVNGDKQTEHRASLFITPREKPDGYLYTEIEILSFVSLDERLRRLEGDPEAGAYATEKWVQDGFQPKGNYLGSEDLPAAIDTALAQAKESGEFDGPQGKPGKDYVLTPEDKKEIAEMAAGLVEVPDSGGNADQFIETTYTQFETFAIDTSGETVDITALVGNENWFHFVKKCKAGSTVYVTCNAGEYYRAWALIDDDGRVLQVAEANAKPRNYPIDIAEDCTLVVNLMKVSSFQNSVTIKEPVGSAKYNPVVKTEDMTHPVGVDDEGRLWVAPIGDSSDGENVEYETTTYTKAEYNKMAINTSGETADLTALVGDNSWSHLAVWCEAGTKVYVTGKGGVSYRTWALVAEDGSVLSASAASEVCENTELTIESACYVVVNAAYGFNTSLTVVIPKKADSAMDIALENRDIINAIQDTLSGRVPFGIGIDCKYTAPDIDAMSIPAVGNRLTYFYGLYDGLLANHSDYISKVDCDAVAVAAGIERPEYMADYPIYLYKFVPAYTSKTNAMDGVTAQRRKIKVFITTGTHPENMAIWDMYNVMRLVCENWETDNNIEALRWDCEIYVMPCSGSYSVENGSRTNYNGVDLNRNAPTANWTLTTEGTNTYSGPSAGSEYETKVFTHFMELLAPDVYIDHHNTDPTGDPGIAIYGTAQHQKEIDILSEHISVMSRRWKKRFQDVFPQDNTSIFGWAGPWDGTGSREGYGAEHVSRSFTYESQWTLLWDNGELVDGAHRGDTVACTCATDGFINFLLRMLKTTW